MIIRLDRLGTVEEMANNIKELETDHKVNGIMILACDANEFTSEAVESIITQCDKQIWGGIFPGIIYENERLEKGTILVGLPQTVKTVVVEGLSDKSTEIEMQIQSLEKENLKGKTMFVFVDGLSSGIVALKEILFDCLGLVPNYVGGGAGSVSFVQKPCIFTNKGLIADAAVLALADIPSGIGVAHGWQPVSEPFKVTEVDRNRIISLNWKPAYQVYRETVEKLSGKSFDQYEFFDLAKGYPFGIIKVAKEMVVRDPIAQLKEKEIICVGEIQENSFVYILKGDKNSLIQGAEEARQLAERSYMEIGLSASAKPTATLFIDCISRVLFLQHDIIEELESVRGDTPMIGALTLGEIANTGKVYLEFYNKTSVVGLLGVYIDGL